ncbi:hypothetical protein [Peribacillus simplex]|nr:hypothetical protein [Peribacillus simplex]
MARKRRNDDLATEDLSKLRGSMRSVGFSRLRGCIDVVFKGWRNTKYS